jgi:hypothetical protein
MRTRAAQKAAMLLPVGRGAKAVDKALHTRAISRCLQMKKTPRLVPSKERRIHPKIMRPRPLPQRRMSRWQMRLRRMSVKKKQKRRTRLKFLNCQIRRRLPLNQSRNRRRSRQEVDLLKRQMESAPLPLHRSARLRSRSRRLYLRGPPQRQAKRRPTAALQLPPLAPPQMVPGQSVAVAGHALEGEPSSLISLHHHRS